MPRSCRQRQRDHGRGHHISRHERRPGPARHPHPPGSSRAAARRAPRRRRPTPLWSTWKAPPANTRSPSAAHCRATPPAPTPRRRLRQGRLPHRLRPPPGHPPPGSGQRGLARPLPDLLAHRRTPVHQDPVPPLPSPHPLHRLRRQCPAPWGFPRDNSVTCNSASGPSSRHPAGRVRSGVAGTIAEFADRHGMRHCLYRGQPKAHLQHVLTVIAVIIERLRGQSATGDPSSPGPPTAFQTFLGQKRDPGQVLAHPRQLSSTIKVTDRAELSRLGNSTARPAAEAHAGELRQFVTA